MAFSWAADCQVEKTVLPDSTWVTVPAGCTYDPLQFYSAADYRISHPASILASGQTVYQILSSNPVVPLTTATTTSSSGENSVIYSASVLLLGAHRELNVTLTSNKVNLCSSPIALRYFFDERLFLDQYQLDELSRFSQLFSAEYHTGLIDVEKPSKVSPSHVVTFTLPAVQGQVCSSRSLLFPFHQRYQDPASDELFRDAVLTNPVLVSPATWVLEYASKQPLVMQVPVGQMQEHRFVSLTTTVVTAVGAIVLIVAMLAYRPSSKAVTKSD